MSDTETIINKVDEPTKDFVATQTRLSCSSGNKIQIANAFCKNAFLQSNTCKLLKKSKSNVKHKGFPFLMFQVLLCAFILFVLIFCCFVIETLWNVTKNNKNFYEEQYFDEHSESNRKFHQQLVNDVNSNPKAKWKAQYNKFASRATDPLIMDKESIRVALTKSIEAHDWSKSQMLADTEAQLKYLANLQNFTLPKKFDSRFQWPECSSVHKVVNQGGCGSCWAMSATSVMSDRICIHSHGMDQPSISAQDLIECCSHCGGCRGTVWALFSFVHWKERGIVTGSDYGSYDGCKPYSKSPSCGSPCSIKIYNAKKEFHQDFCYPTCQKLYDKPYLSDLHKADKVYWVKPNILNSVIYSKIMSQLENLLKKNGVNYEIIIKRELVLNGPMIACFGVYDEFQHYKSGIYESMTSPNTKELYGHCAKLIGWGEESNGDRFWIYMNTWGQSWGENGFFRVAIKEIPEEAAAGIPLL